MKAPTEALDQNKLAQAFIKTAIGWQDTTPTTSTAAVPSPASPPPTPAVQAPPPAAAPAPKFDTSAGDALLPQTSPLPPVKPEHVPPKLNLMQHLNDAQQRNANMPFADWHKSFTDWEASHQARIAGLDVPFVQHPGPPPKFDEAIHGKPEHTYQWNNQNLWWNPAPVNEAARHQQAYRDYYRQLTADLENIQGKNTTMLGRALGYEDVANPEDVNAAAQYARKQWAQFAGQNAGTGRINSPFEKFPAFPTGATGTWQALNSPIGRVMGTYGMLSGASRNMVQDQIDNRLGTDLANSSVLFPYGGLDNSIRNNVGPVVGTPIEAAQNINDPEGAQQKRDEQAQHAQATMQVMHGVGAPIAGQQAAVMPPELEEEAAAHAATLKQNPQAAAALTDPEVGAAVVANAKPAFEQHAAEDYARNKPQPTNPNDFGIWLQGLQEHVSQTWNKMGTTGQLAFGLGLPLAFIGMMGGGLPGFLLAAVGLTAAGSGAAMGGAFDQQQQTAQQPPVGANPNTAASAPAAAPQASSEVTPQSAAGETAPPPAAGPKLDPATQQMAADIASASAVDSGPNGLAEVMKRYKPQLEQLKQLSDPELKSLLQQLDPKVRTNLQTNFNAASMHLKLQELGLLPKVVKPEELPIVQGQLSRVLEMLKTSSAISVMRKAARCWEGYEPVPGKKPYSEDSCRPIGSGKKKKKENKKSEKKSAEENKREHFSTLANGTKIYRQNMRRKPDEDGTHNHLAADFVDEHGDKIDDPTPEGATLHKDILKKFSASSPAWQRSAGKNEEGGLNAKGRASYHRETGGTLKAPVTESNPKGERAKRQNSFCSRMCGMKRVNTGSKTKSDPDSRINKSLRKWNCKCSSAMEFGEKIAQLEQQVGDAAHLGAAVNT